MMRIHDRGNQSRGIIGLALLFGFLFWLIDSLLISDNPLFKLLVPITGSYEKLRFIDAFALDVPPQHLLNRGFAILFCLIAGFIITRYVDRYRRSEERFRSMVEASSDWIWEIDPSGRYTYCSPNILDLLGYTADEIVGRCPLDLMLTEEAERIAPLFEQILNACRPFSNIQNVNRHKDGRSVVLETSGVPFFSNGGRLLGYRGIDRDISERVEAHDALARKESLLRSLINSIPDLIFYKDLDSVYLGCNQAFEAFIARKQEQIIGKNDLDLFPSEVGDSFHKHDQQMLNQGEPHRNQEWVNYPDGRRVLLDTLKTPYQGPDGKTLGLIGISRDITKQHLMVKELQRSEMSLAEAQRIAHIGNWDLDLISYELHWSDEIFRIFEIDPERFGASYEDFLDVIHPDDRAMVNRAYKKSVEDRVPYDIIHRLLMKDGRIKYVREQCETYYDDQGKPIRSGGTVQDISRLVEAEQGLRTSEKRFRSLVEQSPLSIQIYSPDGSTLMVNRAWRRLWGAGMDILADYNILQDQQLVEKGLMPQIQRGFAGEAVSMPPIIYNPAEVPGLPRELANTARWIKAFIYPIRNDREEIQEIVLVHEDVTDKVESEAELERYRQHLEELVQERTAALETTNRELESFSYSVSHDLRAPLRSIDGFSQALLEDYRESIDETGRDYLQRVRNASQRMGQLIDDLLMLSRLTRRKMSRQPTDLSQLAHQAVQELEEQDPERRVKIEIEPGLTAPADPTLMGIALNNLIGNAWKYTSGKGHPSISVGRQQRDEEIIFFVCDNGVGFDMKYASKLFGAFQRLHQSSEFEGTGIGLAIVARVIHRHGGRVWAEAEKGVGACFYFTLGG